MKKHFLKVQILSLCLSITLKAEEKHHHHESLAKHIHGEANLNLILEDDKKGELEFEAPGMDVVGFEYDAKTPKEKEKLNQVLSEFKNKAQELFVLDASLKCVLTPKEVAWESEDHEESEGAHRDHEKQPVAEHHAIEASYVVICQKPLKGTRLNLELFKKFKSLKKINFQYMGSNLQRASELSAGKSSIEL
jgi:hypothetical protein